MEVIKTIKERLKQLRKENGITQQKLADKLNIPRYNIGNYENGRAEPSIEMLIILADFFAVSIDYLVGRTL